MDTFLGRSSTFWSGVEALAVCVYTVVVIVTLGFIYRQVRTGAMAFQLDAIRRLQELVDDFREDRRLLFTTLPLDLVFSHEQFSKQPPGRHTVHRLSEDELRSMAPTPEQKQALESLGEEQLECARRVIARLNDIGQLIEDHFIDRRVFLGKYHVMVIQCCHLVEAIRREDEKRRGGNYGQRLLRMRHWATVYNDVSPKHRDLAIEIKGAHGCRVAYQSPSPTFLQHAVWAIRRWLRFY